MNYTIAPWVASVSVYWAWTYCEASELDAVEMKSHFAFLCYSHLHPKIPINQLATALSVAGSAMGGKKKQNQA